MDACAIALWVLLGLAVPFLVLAGWVMPIFGSWEGWKERAARIPFRAVLAALAVWIVAAIIVSVALC
jgi:hypothetical protein